MAQAVALAKLYSVEQVDRALGTAAVTARFAESDLLSILDYQAVHDQVEPTRRSETHSLQPGTAAWATFGQPTTPPSTPCAPTTSSTPNTLPSVAHNESDPS